MYGHDGNLKKKDLSLLYCKIHVVTRISFLLLPFFLGGFMVMEKKARILRELYLLLTIASFDNF